MPWPTPPRPDDPPPPFEVDLPYDHVRVFLPGVKFAQYSVVRNNVWGQQLQGILPDERLQTTWQVMEAFEAVPLDQQFPLRLHLPDAAGLHLAAHIGGITTNHDVWDEILEQLKRSAARQDPGQPSIIGQTPRDPNARTMRQEVALVAAELARYIEEVFGEDAPPLVANRKLVSQLIEASWA